jgi:nucleoside-specific outer membrane channel protein Tsx
VFSVDQLGTPQIVRFGGANGWSYSEHYVGYGGGRNQSSRFSTADIASRLDMSAPNTGYVLVEIFYNYYQKLSLPWITAFVHDPVMLHAFTIMPLTSAEPTPTPIP